MSTRFRDLHTHRIEKQCLISVAKEREKHDCVHLRQHLKLSYSSTLAQAIITNFGSESACSITSWVIKLQTCKTYKHINNDCGYVITRFFTVAPSRLCSPCSHCAYHLSGFWLSTANIININCTNVGPFSRHTYSTMQMWCLIHQQRSPHRNTKGDPV